MKNKKKSTTRRKAAGTSAKPRAATKKAGKPAAARTAEDWVLRTIMRAARENAEAVHIEQGPKGMSVRFRVDNALRPMPVPAESLQDGVIPKFKTMARMKPDSEALPQDGRFGAIVDDREVDFRVSGFPTAYGESLVMRLFDRANLMPMDRLGFLDPAMTKVRALMDKPQGLILVAGPAGSGRTMTLYGMLSEMNRKAKKVVTLEYPVEFALEGINQTQVNPRAGFDYPDALRVVLHQDPDVVMVGGLDNAEVARAALQTALNGKLVLSTILANDAAEAIARLVDMGVEPFLIASGLEGVIAQRVVRLICPSCKHGYVPGEAAGKALGLEPGQKLFKGRRCKECNNTGFKGRTGIYEVVPMTDEIRNLVLTRPRANALRALYRNSGTTLLDDGMTKVKNGTTMFDEIMRVAPGSVTGLHPGS